MIRGARLYVAVIDSPTCCGARKVAIAIRLDLRYIRAVKTDLARRQPLPR